MNDLLMPSRRCFRPLRLSFLAPTLFIVACLGRGCSSGGTKYDPGSDSACDLGCGPFVFLEYSDALDESGTYEVTVTLDGEERVCTHESGARDWVSKDESDEESVECFSDLIFVAFAKPREIGLTIAREGTILVEEHYEPVYVDAGGCDYPCERAEIEVQVPAAD